MSSGLYNKTAGAQVDAWVAAERGESSAALRSEISFWNAMVEGMADHLDSLQEAVLNERGLWNSIAGGAGCVLGGIAGFFLGGGQGAMQGCKTGSKVTTVAADYVYDSDKWDTPKEKAMKEYAEEFEKLDIDLSEVAKRFPDMGGYDQEMRLEDWHSDYYDDYEEFKDGFYGKEGHDYMTELIATGIDFFGSQGYQAMQSQEDDNNANQQSPESFFEFGDYDDPIGPPEEDTIGDEPIYDDPNLIQGAYYDPYDTTSP